MSANTRTAGTRADGSVWRIVRNLLGLTVEDMAAALDVSIALYSKVETGQHGPSPRLERHMAVGCAGLLGRAA
jgi:transcriptional regulator with XRE-family HTH domain